MQPLSQLEAERIRECVARITNGGALGSGRNLPMLLEYLTMRTIQGKVTHQIDIAVDVFGDADSSSRDAHDSVIRGHVYKLRRRLENYYSQAGKDDPYRLEIPKGSYRVRVRSRDEFVAVKSRRVLTTRHIAMAVTALVFLLASVVFNLWLLSDRQAADSPNDLIAESPMWSGFQDTDRSTLIVVGDFFFFSLGNEPGSGRIRIRDVSVNSREDLEKRSDLVPSTEVALPTFSYLPKSSVFGLQSLLPVFLTMERPVSLKLASELTSADLRDYNVVYLGFFRSMGILQSYFFSRSNFSGEPPFTRFSHDSSGDVYTQAGSQIEYNRDFGLISRFDGPDGNAMLVIAGIGDVGVLAAARSVATLRGLKEIKESLPSPHEVEQSAGYEVLLEAHGHSRTDLAFEVVGSYPLGDLVNLANIR